MQVVAIFALAIIIVLALRTFQIDMASSPSDKIARILRLGPQNWSMFGMGNVVSDSWMVMPARLADGSEVDLFRDGNPVDWSKPPKVGAIYPSYRWMQYLHFKPRWPMYARYAQRAWNQRHPPSRHVESLEIYEMVEVTHADHVDEPKKQLCHRAGHRAVR